MGIGSPSFGITELVGSRVPERRSADVRGLAVRFAERDCETASRAAFLHPCATVVVAPPRLLGHAYLLIVSLRGEKMNST
jgi:hypothetical protein